MLAGVMSRCITPRRCIPATALANSTASSIRSSTASGLASAGQARAANVRQHDRARVPRRLHQLRDPVDAAQPLQHRPLMLAAAAAASGPSGSLRITVRPARNSRVTRVRSLSCTVSARTGGSPSGNTPTAPIRHLQPVGPLLAYTHSSAKATTHSDPRPRRRSPRGWRGPDQARVGGSGGRSTGAGLVYLPATGHVQFRGSARGHSR